MTRHVNGPGWNTPDPWMRVQGWKVFDKLPRGGQAAKKEDLWSVVREGMTHTHVIEDRPDVPGDGGAQAPIRLRGLVSVVRGAAGADAGDGAPRRPQRSSFRRVRRVREMVR